MRVGNVFILSILSFAIYSPKATADVPTSEENCLLNRMSLCKIAASTFTRTDGLCPDGTVTVKAAEPNKDCSPSAIAQAEQPRIASPKKVQTTEEHQLQKDMTLIPWTTYLPFLSGLVAILLGLAFLVRRATREGASIGAVLFRMLATFGATIICGGLAGKWALSATMQKFQNADGLAGGIIGLMAAILAFSVVGILVGALIKGILKRWTMEKK